MVMVRCGTEKWDGMEVEERMEESKRLSWLLWKVRCQGCSKAFKKFVVFACW